MWFMWTWLIISIAGSICGRIADGPLSISEWIYYLFVGPGLLIGNIIHWSNKFKF